MVRHIVVQPSIFYYAWQVEVLIFNLIENGTNPNNIDIVCSKNENLDMWQKMATHYNTVRFFFYDDTRENPKYISSIRPHLLEKHFTNRPELKDEVIFYHDCDIIFTKPIDHSKWLEDNKTWWVSDTISYIGYNYIISKGQEVFDKMTQIVDIDPQLVIDNQPNSGGAQYIMKNVDANFWADVYKDSENLFFEVTKLNNEIKSKNPKYHEIQIWCADMWAVLWNAWKRGFITKVDQDMSFSWGTSPMKEWEKHNIYHNAGVTTNNGQFYKYDYRAKLPYYTDLEVSDSLCNYNYYQYVKKVGKKSILKWIK
jgi:hypothetical protein